MMSVSLPCASIVMLPADVAIFKAASPTVKSSYAVDIVVNDRTPEPFVVIACPEEPSAFGKANVYAVDTFPTDNPT